MGIDPACQALHSKVYSLPKSYRVLVEEQEIISNELLLLKKK